MTTRSATSYLNYRGDRRSILDAPHVPLGPNLLGELLYPVTAHYDPETDRTRVGLSLIAPSPAVQP